MEEEGQPLLDSRPLLALLLKVGANVEGMTKSTSLSDSMQYTRIQPYSQHIEYRIVVIFQVPYSLVTSAK